jgi:two-component system NtrC family sensor kinase
MLARRRGRSVLTRVLWSYALITASFSLVAGYSVIGQRESARDTERMRTGYMPLQLALRDAVASQNTYNSQLNHITETKNPKDKRVWFETTLNLGRPKTFEQIRQALQRAFGTEDRALGEDVNREAEGIQRFLEADREILSQLFEALREQRDAQSEPLRDNLVTRGTQALIMLRNLEERVNMQLDSLLEEAARRERQTLRVLLAWALLTVLGGAGVAVYAGKLLRPLAAVTERAKAVAQGDLTPREVTATNDEIGELSQTFESMVTAIARANRELLESERLATIGKMAAQVTHEVRNPLSSIGLNLELLEEEIQSDEARSLHAAIQREVQRLNDLTEQYLSVARRDDPKFEREDLAVVLREAAAFVTPDLLRHDIQLLVETDPDLPEVWVDEAQIRQVIYNLVRNARQAMPRGGTVTLTARNAPLGVELRIADTGVGIPKEARSQLFEPFFTTKSEGTGLGLAISRRMVESHHGTIRCEPSSPQGTVFIITLPLDPRTSSEEQAPVAEA